MAKNKQEEIEVFQINDKCKIEFDRLGNIKIGKGCAGVVINPVELHLIDRVNEELGNE